MLQYCKGTVRTRFWRHLLCALPFIVFAIRRYCCILFTAKHLKIYSPKVRSNQKLRFCPQTRQGPQAVPSARSRALTQYRGKIRAFDRVPIIPLQYNRRERLCQEGAHGSVGARAHHQSKNTPEQSFCARPQKRSALPPEKQKKKHLV